MAQTDRLSNVNEPENDVSPTTASGTTAVQYASRGTQSVEIKNIGLVDIYFKSGDSMVTVDVAGGCCIPPSQTLVYSKEVTDTHFAVRTEAGTGRARIKGGLGI